jgi:ubiquinone/menaquinone biosynthesis C-methylase UbiE
MVANKGASTRTADSIISHIGIRQPIQCVRLAKRWSESWPKKIPGDAERILDVECGLGASTQRLGVRFAPGIITAINISVAQLALARERAPGSTFLFMNATALQFPDANLNAVICV